MSRVVRVLGVDPGMASTGLAVIDQESGRFRLIHYSVLRSSPREALTVRLQRIHLGVRDVIEGHGVRNMAIERVYVGKNVRSALTLGHARAASILSAALEGVEVAEYTPTEVKRAVGAGGAGDKDQVWRMVRMLVSGLPEKIPVDASDAIAIAICHLNRYSVGRLH